MAALLAFVLVPSASVGAVSGPVDGETLAAQWRRDDDRALCATAAILASYAHEVEFSRMRERIDDYADWVFGWTTSLLASYELLAVGLEEASRRVRAQDGPTLAQIEARWERFIDEKFDELLVAPARHAEALDRSAHAIRRWLGAFDRTLARNRARRIAALPAAMVRDREALVARFGSPRLGAIEHWERPAPGSGPALRDQQIDVVLYRSLRPFGSRLLGMAARSGAVELIAAVALVQSYEIGGVAGFVASGLIAGALTGGIDYSANAVHTWLERDDFEAELSRLLDDAERLAGVHSYQDFVARAAAVPDGLGCPADYDAARALAPLLPSR